MNQSKRETTGGAGREAVTHPLGASMGGGMNLDALMEQIRADVEQGRSPTQQAGRSVVLTDDGGAEPPPRPPLSVAEIMARVREEVTRRRQRNAPAHEPVAVTACNAAPATISEQHLARWQPAAPRLADKPQYVLGDFLRFDDADFVDVAYQALLHRSPEPEGGRSYLDALRAGSTSKVEILGLIRFSEEGRKQRVHVDGLLLPYKLHQWRHRKMIGPVLGFVMAMFRLPRLALRLQGIEANAARETHELGRLLDRVDTAVEKHFADVDGAIHTLRAELTQSVMARTEGLRALSARTVALQVAVKSVNDTLRASDAERAEQHRAVQERLAAHEDVASALERSLRASDAERTEQHYEVQERMAAQENVASALERSLRASDAERAQQHEATLNRLLVHDAALAKLSEQTRNNQRSLRGVLDRLTVFLDVTARRAQGVDDSTEEGPPLEPQYASFDDDFRGEREQIKLRAAHYLGTLKNAGIEPGSGVVLDLGSGRGQWLEVLTEHDYACRGVDLNRGMLKDSLSRGHEVVEADAVDYLRTLDDGSIAAITSMHLVEHIPHPVLIQLLDEALRVLRPGGVLILETPNPENVLVGSCMFYMDPTHLQPIPPLLLQWVVKARGFAEPVIERLSEHRGAPDLVPVSDKIPGAKQINQMIGWFTAPPDYAVIARKL